MRVQPALVAAASVLGVVPTASSFLIPSTIADAAQNGKDAITSLIAGRGHQIDVDCHQCPFFAEDKKTEDDRLVSRVVVNGVENKIHLDIFADSNGLRINNVSVYPFEAVAYATNSLSAHQIKADGTPGVEVPVDFSVQIATPVQSQPVQFKHRKGPAPPDNYELSQVDFTVIRLGGERVQAQAAHIDLIHDLNQATYEIVDVRPAAFNPVAEPDVCQDARNYDFCRVRELITSQMRQMMDAAMARAQGMKEWIHGQTQPKPAHKPCSHRLGHAGNGPLHHPHHESKGSEPGHPEHHHGHHSGGHHRGHHKGMCLFHRIVHYVLMPAMIGIACGLAASALGMIVGQLIAFLWMRFGRGGRRGSAGNIRLSEDEVVVGEKEGLMVASEEDLPKYEDVDLESQPKED